MVYSFIVRLFAAASAGIILSSGVFFAWTYFDKQYSLVTSEPERALSISTSLLELLLILGVTAAVLGALLLYTLLSVRVAASHLAETMTSDIAWSREQFRRFYDLSPVPYLLITPQGMIDRPNKATVRFFGLPEDVLTGENLFAFLTAPPKEDRLPFIREQVGRRIPVDQVEVQARKKSGEVRWIMLSIQNISTPGSRANMGLVTFVDIHEQKELERIKTEFLSLASHQLRAPLANLKWYIDFLLHRRSEQLTDEIKKYLFQMNARNEDMIDLVNTLLNMSRVEMGHVRVEKQQADLSHLIGSILEELDPARAAKNLTLDREVPESLPLVTDPKLVRIVFQNLVTNAIRYTGEGGRVTVTAGIEGDQVHLMVKDTGVGIPPEEQGKIFSKLYRASNAQQLEASGTGLGLYMSKALVEEMGGSIGFTTKLGEGTTFTVTLPTR